FDHYFLALGLLQIGPYKGVAGQWARSLFAGSERILVNSTPLLLAPLEQAPHRCEFLSAQFFLDVGLRQRAL
ncbi:hypothetical protein, partial [Xanthobacter autotrophicus]|uniref:hypothetical protein n=1 Tax=Xanthobacter autotrophicus TaxID=280 RepID=UPI00372714BA